MFRKILASSAIVVVTFALDTPKVNAVSMTEFCVNNSPDGILNLRAAPSRTSYTYDVLRNGDCGIYIAPRAARSGVFVRATVNGQRGWVKSKWIIRAEDVEVEGC
jgi:hypothetical protein